MKPDTQHYYLQEDSGDDEIEILEVVGLDEDHPADGLEGPDDPEAENGEITVDFDDDDTTTGGAPPGGALSDREQLVRMRADFENFKKRVEREQEASQRHASASLVTRLLPVLDNFERALSGPQATPDGQAFQQGVALIFRQLLDELRREGLASVDSLGQPFDPNLHEAVATTTVPGLAPNTIVEELRRGYLLHDRLLRPAQVRVCVGDPDAPADAEAGEDE